MELRSPFANFNDENLAQQKLSLDQVIDASKALYTSIKRKQKKNDMNPFSFKLSSVIGSAKKNDSTNQKKKLKNCIAHKSKTLCGNFTPSDNASSVNFLHFVRCTSSDFESTPAIKEIKKKISIAVRTLFKVDISNFACTLKPQGKNVKKKKIVMVQNNCSRPPREKVVLEALKRFKSSTLYQVLQDCCFDALTMLHASQTIPSRDPGSEAAFSSLPKSLDDGRHRNTSVDKRITCSTAPFLSIRGENVAEVFSFDEEVANKCVDQNENGSTNTIRYHCNTPSHCIVGDFFESEMDCGTKGSPESTKETHCAPEGITFCQYAVGEDEEGDFLSPFTFSPSNRVDEALCVVKKKLKDAMKAKSGHSSLLLSSLRSRSRTCNQEASSQSSMFSSITSTFEGRGLTNLHPRKMESGPLVKKEEVDKREENASPFSFYTALKVLVESKMIDVLIEEDTFYWESLVALILDFLHGKEDRRLSSEALNLSDCSITSALFSERFSVLEQLGLQMCEAASGFQLHQFLVEILHLMDSEFCQDSLNEEVGKAECSNPESSCVQSSSSIFLTATAEPPNVVCSSFSQQPPLFCDHCSKLLTSKFPLIGRLHFVALFVLHLIGFLPQCWFNLVEEEVREVLYATLRVSLHLSALFSVLDSSAKWLETWITQRSCVSHQLAVWPVAYPEDFLTLCRSTARHDSACSLLHFSEEGVRCRTGDKHDSYRLAVASLVLPLVCGMYLSPCCLTHTFPSQCSVSQEQQKWVLECVRTLFCSSFSFSSFSSLLQPDRSSCLTMIVAACFQSRLHFPAVLQSSLCSLVIPFLLSLPPHIGDDGISMRVDPLGLNRIFQLVLLFIPSQKAFPRFCAEERLQSSCASSLHQMEITGSEKRCVESRCDTSLEDLDRWVATLLGSVLDTLQKIFSSATRISTFSSATVEDDFRLKEKEKVTSRNVFHPDLWSACRQYLHVLQSFCIAALPHIADRFSATLSLCFLRISDFSSRNFFAFLELPSTLSQTLRCESDIRTTSCVYCPSFCHLFLAASLHPCGWVQIRQMYYHSSLFVKREETTFLVGSLLSSTSVPLACISTCQLLFSILTCNVLLMNEKKMCDELPCYPSLNYCISTRTTSDFHLRNHCNAKIWLALLAALTPFSSLAVSASSPLPVCRSCTAMYRSSMDDRSTSLFLLQRWSAVSASFLKFSFSEVAEKVCCRIKKYLGLSLPSGAASEAKRSLCRISPTSLEDVLWSETYESGVNYGGASGVRHGRLFSSFSYSSLFLWQSFFHSCLLLEAPFPPKEFFSDFRKRNRNNNGTAKSCCTTPLNVSASSKSEADRSSFLPFSLLSRATQQVKTWRFLRNEGPPEARVNSGDKGGSHVEDISSSHYSVSGDRSALFTVLTLIAWGLWLSPVTEVTFATSSVTSPASSESSQARLTPSAVMLFGTRCCGNRSSFEFKSLLECTEDLLREGNEEKKNGVNFIDPCTILFATIVCSFFEKVGNSSLITREEMMKDAEYNNNGKQNEFTLEGETKDSHPSLSSDNLSALMWLMRAGGDVSWSSDIPQSFVWLSLLEKCQKWKFCYRHNHRKSGPPANMEAGHAVYSCNGYQANSLSASAAPVSEFSFPLTENLSISSAVRVVKLHLSLDLHWKRWIRSFSSLASYTSITAAHIQRLAALMVLYETHCRRGMDEPYVLRKCSSSEGPLTKKSIDSDIAERWDKRMSSVFKRVVRQCITRKTWEWELFLGVEREAIFQSTTAASLTHSEISKTVDIVSGNCSSCSSPIEMAFFDKWKLVREIVTKIYENRLVDSKCISALSFHGIDLFWLIHVGITTWIAPPSFLFTSYCSTTSQKNFFEQNAAYFVSCYTFLYFGGERWKNWLASKFGTFISRIVSCASVVSSLKDETKRSTPNKITEEKGGGIALESLGEFQCISRAFFSYFSKFKQESFFPHTRTLDTQHLSGMPAISSVCTLALLHGFYHSSSIFSEDEDLK